ncbi:polysaccharide biosynthesis/export family protein [Celeribacter indicus]|uniref:Polysaccharide biosynthesis/export family protein n=1 Tax=Celeribacter indicus TaxID=1208324 RepID=A0A0B5DYD1_9RHOB|nr:polysaccharide biosynthesis/export family protein [Celeribacter indicus]AJE48019.1 polysaccharide biosynthesis/export family protein [Celeribacter indicus]SDW29654.1 polysaccharide export outer membrane protein [Celeribacter indicus]
MAFLTSRTTRAVALVAVLASLSACGLPRSGPNKREVFSGSVLNEGDAFVISVNDRVNTATAINSELGFSSTFLNAGLVGSDTISPGDVLSLTIWENVDDGLLAGQGANATALSEVQVDGDGFIFVPYAGRIKAAGNSPEAIRRIITEKLDAQTPDPQVMVTRAAGNGATVTVSGKIGAQGVYPIERPTRRLTAMLAAAGGPSVEPEVAQVKVMRGGRIGTIWFNDLYSNPKFDIPLRDGDRVLVEADPRSYTALGATGAQSVIPFKTRDLSALEAIAQVGGLQTNSADPKGVFVFRNEPEQIARIVLGRTDLIGPQRVVYVLDLTQPNGLFLARDFLIRDGDTVYVTEAPFVQWQKTLSAITGTAGSANQINSLAGQ